MARTVKTYNLESPVAIFRTAREHWEFYTSGIIRVRSLTIADDGKTVIPGNPKITLQREELNKRPDILNTLIKVLETWRP